MKKSRRKFSYLTVGDVLQRLREEGLNISRTTFYRLEKENLFIGGKTAGKWRVYTKNEIDAIVYTIKENYRIKNEDN